MPTNTIIKRIKSPSKKVKAFEKKEWLNADIEHYGEAKPYSKKSYKFAAYEDDETVAGILDLDIEANVAFVENLLVGENFRGKGIGKQLISYAEKFARGKDCTKIWLSTVDDWEAVKFYKKVGYKITATHEKHFLGKRELILTKFF